MGGVEPVVHQSLVKDFFLFYFVAGGAGGYFGNRHHAGSPSGGARGRGRCECSSADPVKLICPSHANSFAEGKCCCFFFVMMFLFWFV